MKRNHLAITLGIILGVSALTGCTKSSTNDTSISKEKESEENTVYGEVKSVGESSVTIEVGTMKEMEKDGENPSGAGKEENTDSAQTDGEGENQPPQGGEQPSMLDLTGEEKEIKITDDTVIQRQSMGGGPGRVEKLRLPMERHRKNQKILPEQQRAVPTTAQRAVPEVIVKTGKSRVKIRLNSKQRLSL